MKINSILFDLDNTIYPESDYFLQVITEFCQIEHVDFHRFDFLFRDFDSIRFGQSNIFQYILVECNEYTDKRQELLFNLYTSIETTLKPYPGIQEWLDDCRSKSIQIGILTNGIIGAQNNKWKCLDMDKSEIIFHPSRSIGKDKPDPATFEKFMAISGFEVKNTLFVGDRFKNDLEFGYTAGAPCCLIGSTSDKVPYFQDQKTAFTYFQTEFIEN